MKHRYLFVFATLVCTSFVFAQQRPQTSLGVGNAVLLAANSIQIDQAAVVVSGDLIVNNATSGPVLGELALSLDRSVTTPAGYKLVATSVGIRQAAVVHGDVYYNTLSNLGSITGALFTPLALPVFATLPTVIIRPAGSNNVTVANAGQVTLDRRCVRGSRRRQFGDGAFDRRRLRIPIDHPQECCLVAVCRTHRHRRERAHRPRQRLRRPARKQLGPHRGGHPHPGQRHQRHERCAALDASCRSCRAGWQSVRQSLRDRGLDRHRSGRGRKRCVHRARHSRRTGRPPHHQQRLQPGANRECADRLRRTARRRCRSRSPDQIPKGER